MKAGAIIVAGGRGARAGGPAPKQFQILNGRRVIEHSIAAFQADPRFVAIVAVTPDGEGFGSHFGPKLLTAKGGTERTQSVAAGLHALSGFALEAVFVHDAARPGLSAPILDALFQALETAPAAAPALPLSDMVWRLNETGQPADAPDRSALIRVQTPQAFHADLLLRAYSGLPEGAFLPDDVSVVKRLGASVTLIPGDRALEKITYPGDLAFLERVLGPAPGEIRAGQGFDAHRFGPGAFVTLCGVQIPHGFGLIGHSDADAGWHALTDAILGAIGAGDIGEHFSPKDPRWKGAASGQFLLHARDLAREQGFEIANADITLICEAPRIGPHREAMRAKTAALLGLPVERISVKATTTEKMGFTGRQEGLAAQAIALLQRARSP